MGQKIIIAVIQHKGGAGKTTTAINLATMIKELRPKAIVALADADVRGDYFAAGWLDPALEPGILVKRVAEDGEGRALKRELEEIEADLIILDLPPAVEAISLRAAMYADLMLIPLSESGLDLKGAEHAMETCKEFVAQDPRKTVMLVPANINPCTNQCKEMLLTLPKLGRVSVNSIKHRVVYKELVDTGVGINKYRPYSAACFEVRRLAKEVLEIVEKEQADGN